MPASTISKIGRLAVEGWPPASMPQAQAMLAEGLSLLPVPVEYFVGPGGYITVLDPIIGSMPSGWESVPESLGRLRPLAESVSRELVSAIPKHLRSKARYFSYGVDVRDTDPNGWRHAEIVLVTDLKTDKLVVLTAKTYPTEDQTRTLVRAVDWRSHLWLPGNGDRVLVLGCHDLNVYNNRAFTNAAKDKDGFKYRLLTEGRDLFAKFNPTHILHHPHATDIANTWRGAWSGVKETHPRLLQGVSGIGHPKLRSRENDDIAVVLGATQVPRCASIDIVVMGNRSSFGRQADVIPADLDKYTPPEELKQERLAEMRLYERGMKEWEYFKQYGKKMHPRARSTQPAKPPEPHRSVKATSANSCQQTTFGVSGASPSGALSSSSMLPAFAVGIVLGAGTMHLVKRR